MKMRLLAGSALIAIAGQASAAVIILNPGDANIYGQPLSCTVGFDTNPNPPVDPNPPQPPQPPRMVLVPIGQFRSTPNKACINVKVNQFDGNVGHLSTAVASCAPQVFGPQKCDSTQILSSRVDSACFTSVANAAKIPLTSGQQDRIQTACSEITGVCLINRPVNDRFDR